MVQLTVGTGIDDASLRRTANDIQRRFDRAGEEAGDGFITKFAAGVRSGSTQVDKAYSSAMDATGRLRVEQDKLDRLLASGDSNRQKVIQQSERTAKARRDEEIAIRRAADAYKDYGKAGEQAGDGFLGGLRGAISGSAQSGDDMASEFVGGFASASALTRIGAAGGPIGLALAATAVLGITAGRLLAGGIADGMATLQMRDVFQGRMGLDEESMAQYADAAGRAYANNFGASVADNLTATQAALRGGLIDTDTTGAEVQRVVEQLQGLSLVSEATPAELSRSITTLMRTGLAGSVSGASDIITAGFQSGLDVSGDWLDTVNEYSTQFRKFGLDASEVLTLLNQGMEGGARDTDKVADSLKEFSVRAFDGSKLTAQGFAALGFSADEMSQKFAAGGDTARAALDSVFDAIQRTEDPMEQALIWTALFGTQFEDMGDAINQFNLDPAKNEFTDLQGLSDRSTKSATENFASEWETATRTVGQYFSDLGADIAEWATNLPGIKDLPGWVTWMFSPDVQPKEYPAPPPGAADIGNLWLPGSTPAPAASAPSGGREPGAWGGLPPVMATGPENPLTDIFGLQPGGTPGAPPPPDAPVPGERTPMPRGDDPAAGEEAKPTFDPSQWSLDNIPLGTFAGEEGLAAPGPGAVAPPGMANDPLRNPGYGYYEVDSQKVFDAETSRISAQTRLQNDRYKYLEVMADADATEQDKYNARMALVQSGRSLQSSEMKLIEAQQGTWKKMEETANTFASGIDDIGAALDPDFGLSDGISGFVENLTKAVANLAAAPLIGQLSAIKAMNPSQGGSGMFGVLGAQGVFGSRYNGIDYAQQQYGQQAIGPAALQPGFAQGLTPTMLKDTGSVPSGPQSRQAAALVEQYFGSQLRGTIGGSRDNNTAPNTHDAGLSIDIPIGPDQMALGDQINAFLQANASQLGLEYSIWRDKGQYPGGGGFTSGGHQNHIDAHFNGEMTTPYSSSGGLQQGQGSGSFAQFGAPGSQQAIANMIYQQAVGRGYSPHEAQSIVAYAIGESGLNPSAGGGVQGGSGDPFADNVIGLFQQKPAFAQGGGISPAQRTDPMANTTAYLNQLERYRHLPIEQALPATSVGGPLARGGEQPWQPLMNQAADLLGFGSSPTSTYSPVGPVPAYSAPAPGVAAPGAGYPGPGGAPAPGLPGVIPGAAGGQGFLGTNYQGPQVGPGSFGAPGGPAGQPSSVIPGQQSSGAPGGGGSASPIGGIPMAAMMAGASSLDMLAPGAGQAAQTGIQLINRTIGLGAQAAGIAASGLLETFLVSGSGGKNTDPLKTLPGRVLAGLASARPATPNVAGQGGQAQTADQQQQEAQQQGQGGGPLVNIEQVNQAPGQSPDSVANSVANQTRSAELSAGWHTR